MASNITESIDELSRLQTNNQLSILKISSPLLQSDGADLQEHRSSDVSINADLDAPTPASLEVDLTHYKELFTKLRFSYLEQVTKEKFLRSLIELPLPSIPLSTLTALEAQLAETKLKLQGQKATLAEVVSVLETQSRNLTRRYKDVQAQSKLVESLPAEIAQLKEDIAALQLTQGGEAGTSNPAMALPLSQTLQLVAEKELELADLDRQISMATMTLDNKSRELGRLEAELAPLQAQKISLTAAAKEARRRREQGLSGVGDELELQGRWYRGVDAVMRNMLDVGS